MTPHAKQEMQKAWAAALTPKKEKPDLQGLPQGVWAAMSLRTRAVLVMLGAASMEDPRQVARRPWEALSDADRAGIAAVAQTLRKDLKAAVCLF